MESYRKAPGRVLRLAGLVGSRIALAVLLQHWVDVLKGQVQVLSPLGPCKAHLLKMSFCSTIYPGYVYASYIPASVGCQCSPMKQGHSYNRRGSGGYEQA